MKTSTQMMTHRFSTRPRIFLLGAAMLSLMLCAARADETKVAEMRKGVDASIAQGPYQDAWDSLKKHQDPEWFRDAKFGIYTHWGPVTLGADGAAKGMEWYGNQMYIPTHAAFKYHQERFGDQKTVGYKDIIPKFTAEKFNAEEWAELFARSGAKFAGPVAVHHDNFAMWDSQVTRWNAKEMGPHRDTTGELARAIKARGLKFITTFHHGFAWGYYEPAFAYDAADGKNIDLYSEPHKKGDPPTARFQDQWLAMVQEAVTKYQPDLIWFDFELQRIITPQYQRRMFAWYYNWGAHNGVETGVAMKFREIQQYTGILDFERGREDAIKDYIWLTDSSLGPWFHHDCIEYRPLDSIVDTLVDIVSKNGCLLLNVGPRADGSIPDKAKEYLTGIGDWLRVNGEAIFATRPWTVFGEGPTRLAGGGFSENRDRPFTARDIRFTRAKDGALYAFALAWPQDGKIVIRSLAQPAGEDFGKIARVELLGHAGELKFTRGAEALEVALPAQKPCEFAYALKITGENLKAAPVNIDAALAVEKGAVTLDPASAQLHGTKLRLETKNKDVYLAAWDKPQDWASWTVKFPEAGTYEVSVECSSAKGVSGLSIELGGKKITCPAPKTKDWYQYATVNAGRLAVAKPGVLELTLRAADPKAWKAVNIHQVKLVRVM